MSISLQLFVGLSRIPWTLTAQPFGLLKSIRALHADVAVTPDSIVKDFGVVEHVGTRILSGSIDLLLVRSFFRLLKNASVTALSQQLPR
jgi:hypothetical protein